VDGGVDAQVEFIMDALGDLRDTVVGEVMTPRVDVVALTIPLTVESVSKAVRESGHSCFPVCGESLDDLVGMLFVNDLFRAGWAVGPPIDGTRSPGPIDISRRLRQPFLVPESRLVLDVLAEMRRQRRAFAVVVDEHGGVEGVLTVKDLLGALVGDLPDEFDPDEEPEVVRVDGQRWLVDGRMSIDDLCDQLDVELPEGEYVTLGGFLFDAFGHIPAEGESHEFGEWQLRVAEMDKRRIAKVVVKHTPREPDEEGGADGDERGNPDIAVG
jgi:CBS domain containing-hemolysin-like protein